MRRHAYVHLPAKPVHDSLSQLPSLYSSETAEQQGKNVEYNERCPPKNSECPPIKRTESKVKASACAIVWLTFLVYGACVLAWCMYTCVKVYNYMYYSIIQFACFGLFYCSPYRLYVSALVREWTCTSIGLSNRWHNLNDFSNYS